MTVTNLSYIYIGVALDQLPTSYRPSSMQGENHFESPLFWLVREGVYIFSYCTFAPVSSNTDVFKSK